MTMTADDEKIENKIAEIIGDNTFDDAKQLKVQLAQEILTSFDRAFTTHFLTKKTMSKASQHNIFKDVLDQLEFLKDNALMMGLAEKPARKESECKFCCVPRKGHLCPIKEFKEQFKKRKFDSMEDFIEGNKGLYTRFNKTAHNHVADEIKKYHHLHKLAACPVVCPVTPPTINLAIACAEKRAAKRAATVATRAA